MEIKRLLFLSLGTAFLAIGIIGIVLPVLPTTTFVLVSAFCLVKVLKDWKSGFPATATLEVI